MVVSWWVCWVFLDLGFVAEVVVMEDNDDWPPPPPSSTPPSSCSRSIVRRGRTGWELERERERERDSEKGERKSNKEMRGESKS